MARWLITFGVLVTLGSLLSPLLHALGLPRLPGDLLVDFVPGYRFEMPVASALLLSAVIAGVWRLLSH